MVTIFKRIAESMPELKFKLAQASLSYTPEVFIQRTVMISIYAVVGLSLFVFPVVNSFMSKFNPALLLIPPVLLVIVFFYMLRFPDSVILKKQRGISKEIIFAGRFLVIGLESGMTIYDAFKNISANYPVVGKYFQDVVDKVDLGTDIETAINEGVELTPSPDLRKVLWQVLNSLRTGSDVTLALNSVLDQIANEQNIMVKEYGRKLNPLAMFFMIIAIIIPSLGMTMFMIMATFIGLTVGLPLLLVFVLLIGFVQFMFVAIIKSSRPPVEL
ncbi:MAG: type II secretion system F family protein [Nanoarchaeota archaeon]|nr:type II secretion system F family protein [Nanoarchaeota archaeon]